MVCSAQQNVRLNTDRAQFLDGMLRRFGFDLAGARDVWDQGQMHVDDIIAPELDPELTDCLQKRQRLDVADRAANLHHTNVGIARTKTNAMLDLVRDMRNELNRRTQVVADPIRGDDAIIESTGL